MLNNWMLLAKVFWFRMEDNENMQRVVPMETDDPRRIAPTIAVVPPPPSHELSTFMNDVK